VLQFAHNVWLGDFWFTEASASWASVHFNRTAPVRWDDNRGLHEERFGGFQRNPGSLLSTVGDHEYFSYIWPLFMEQQRESGTIGSAWTQLGAVTTAQQANSVLDSLLSFKSDFRVFAVRNVNEALAPGDPVSPRYTSLDSRLPDGTLLPTYDRRPLVGGTPVAVPVDLAGLMASYARFEVGEDSRVQSVEFDFTELSGREHLAVDALIRTSDRWVSKPVRLDDDAKPRFCFDLGPSTETLRGSFDELRLVLSNYSISEGNVVAGDLRVRPSRGGCSGWSGTIEWSHKFAIPGAIDSDASTVATVTFEVDPDADSTPGVVPYRVRSGHLRYRAEVITHECRTLATADVEMAPEAASGEGATVASLATFATDDLQQYGANSGATFGAIVEVGNCTADGSEATTTHANQLIPWWSLPGIYDLKENGTVMEEEFTTQAQGGAIRNKWSLRKVEAPSGSTTKVAW